jgi:hypothetical protein
MKHPGKVVLISTSGYFAARDDSLLQELIYSRVELFCAVGIDAEKWEDALDWMCIGPTGEGEHFITTTSHPQESEEEVIWFAKQFSTQEKHEVEVIRV